LAAALGSVNIDAELIEEARKKALEKGEVFNIRNVILTDEQLRKLGLKRE
jgi:aspartate 1-decarboxylase